MTGEPPLGVSTEVQEKVDSLCAFNLESGRAAKVMRRFIQDTDDETTVAEISAARISRYRNLVMTIYLRESEYVERLYQRDRDAWERLWANLHRACRHMLLRRSLAARETVEDFVQQTCETVFISRFPYDVSFDAWVNTILNNHILQRYTRSREFLDRIHFVLSLDVANDESEENGSPRLDEMIQELGPDAFALFDDRMLIFDAIERLGSQQRQDVILYTYFLGWSDEEIAQKLNKSIGAIHTLRHRAIKELRGLIKP